MAYTQKNRRISLTTPLGTDVVLLRSFAGREELSRLYTYQLELLSAEDTIDPKDIVGKPVSFSLMMTDETPRYFNGFVSRFVYHGKGDRFSSYSAEVVPALWFLTRNSDCRIFQGKTVVQIVSQIFDDLDLKDYNIEGITGKHQPWDYCVQYRETDFNFISRLLEHEGIFYYFKHEEGKTLLMLADSAAAYQQATEGEVKFVAHPEAENELSRWDHTYEFQPGKWAHTDFNFETPSTNLLTKTNSLIKLEGNDKLEVFDFPGEYEKKPDGDADAKVRIEEFEARYDTVRGAGACASFSPALKFTLAEHPLAAEANKGWVLTAVQHRASAGGSYVSGSSEGEDVYTNTFECIPDDVCYRPARVTPKPLIHGAQTAIVVGPAGEEIFTDKYGRVKVHFHWDRAGSADEKASCWIRVAQIWAGKKWGGMFIPRIGQEVVVDFLEGDPDLPLITGRVYNAENMPPYELPANMTRSGIKTLSTKEGDGFNELRFEDKKGSEQIFIHGEKDQDVRIKNDSMEWVGHDRHLIVKNMQIEHIEVDRHETIDRDHQEKIGRDRHTAVTGKEARSVGTTFSLKVGGNVAEVFSDCHSEQVTNDYYLKAENIVIEAMTNVTIKVGQSYIAIESGGITIGTTGTIELKSTGQTSIEATGGIDAKGMTVSVKADTSLSLQGGAMAELKGPMVTAQADGIMTVKGGMVMIN